MLDVHPVPAAPSAKADPVWYPYRGWGYAPRECMTIWMHLVELFLGRQMWLIYIGITCRAGHERWSEHEGFGQGRMRLPPKSWMQYCKRFELDDRLGFASREEAEAHENALIADEMPLGNIAGRGRIGHDWKRPTRRRAMVETAVVARRVKVGATITVFTYLTVSLPRLTTGEWPGGPLELAAWAAAAAALMLSLRAYARRHWMGARTNR